MACSKSDNGNVLRLRKREPLIAMDSDQGGFLNSASAVPHCEGREGDGKGGRGGRYLMFYNRSTAKGYFRAKKQNVFL